MGERAYSVFKFSVGDTVKVLTSGRVAKVIKTPSEFDEIPRQWQTGKCLIAYLDSGKLECRAPEEMVLHDGASDSDISSKNDAVTLTRLPSRVAVPISNQHRPMQVITSVKQFFRRRRQIQADSTITNAEEH